MSKPKPIPNISQADAVVATHMQEIAGFLDKYLKDLTGQKMSFSLCVFNATPGAMVNYASNCVRDDVANAWTTIIEDWKTEVPKSQIQ